MNDYKSCSCTQCRAGRRRRYGKFVVKATKRKFRRQAKQSLRNGEHPEPVISTPYTD